MCPIPAPRDRRVGSAAALAAILLSLVVNVAWGAWAPNGTPFCAAGGSQFGYGAVPDDAGGFFSAWRDLRSGDRFEVYVVRMTGQGTPAPGWPVNGRPVYASTNPQEYPLVAPDGAGGVYVGWCRTDGNRPPVSMFVQHLLGNGQKDPAWPDSGVVPIPWRSNTYYPCLAADGAGGVLVVWYATDDGTTYRLWAQRLDANGARSANWPESGVALPLGGDPMMIPDGSGGAIVAFQNARRVRAIRVAGQGSIAAGWPVTGVDLSGLLSSNIVLLRGIAGDGAGGAYVLWHGVRHGLQRIGADGSVPAGWSLGGREFSDYPSFASESRSALAPDGEGGCYVALDGASDPAMSERLYLNRFGADGAIAPGWPGRGVVACQFEVDFPHVALRSGGGCFVTWRDSRLPPGNPDVYLSGFTADGTHPGWPSDGLAVCTAAWNQDFPRVMDDGLANALVTWEDSRSGTTSDLYATRIASGVTLTLASATVSQATVLLEWLSDGITSAVLERRETGGGWQDLATLQPDGAGLLRYEDHDVVPGMRLEYRLRTSFGTGVLHGGAVAIEIPLGAPFEFAGARPNPATDALSLAFRLDRTSVVRIELVDVNGRVVLTHEETRHPGLQVVTVPGAERLPAGVYQARLESEGRSLSRSVVLVH